MIKIISSLQCVTNNSSSKYEAISKLKKIFPLLNDIQLSNIITAGKQFVIGEMNSLELQTIIKENGFQNK